MTNTRNGEAESDEIPTLGGFNTSEFFYSMTYQGQCRLLTILGNLKPESKLEGFVALCDAHLMAASLSVSQDGVIPKQLKQLVSVIVDHMCQIFGHTDMPNFEAARDSAKRIIFARAITGAPVSGSEDIHDILTPLKLANQRRPFDPRYMPGAQPQGGEMPKATPNQGKAQVNLPVSPQSNRQGPQHLQTLAAKDPRSIAEKTYSAVVFKAFTEMVDNMFKRAVLTSQTSLENAMVLTIREIASSYTPKEFATDMSKSGYKEGEGHYIVMAFLSGYVTVLLSKRFNTPDKVKKAMIGVHEATIYPPPKHGVPARLAPMLAAEFIVQDELRQIKLRGGPVPVDPAEITKLFSTADQTAQLESFTMSTPDNQNQGQGSNNEQGSQPVQATPLQEQLQPTVAQTSAVDAAALETLQQAIDAGTADVVGALVETHKTVTKTVKSDEFEFNLPTIVSGLFSLSIFSIAVWGTVLLSADVVIPWLTGLGLSAFWATTFGIGFGALVVGVVGYGCYKVYGWFKDFFFGESTNTKVVAKVDVKTEVAPA